VGIALSRPYGTHPRGGAHDPAMNRWAILKGPSGTIRAGSIALASHSQGTPRDHCGVIGGSPAQVRADAVLQRGAKNPPRRVLRRSSYAPCARRALHAGCLVRMDRAAAVAPPVILRSAATKNLADWRRQARCFASLSMPGAGAPVCGRGRRPPWVPRPGCARPCDWAAPDRAFGLRQIARLGWARSCDQAAAGGTIRLRQVVRSGCTGSCDSAAPDRARHRAIGTGPVGADENSPAIHRWG